MSEITISPCPYCGNTQIDYYNVPYASFFGCSSCGLCGPRELYKDNAALAWNVLPRRLKWTREKPTKTGHYWWKKPDVADYPTIAFYEAEYDTARIVGSPYYCRPEDVGGEWAGPIPEPIEQTQKKYKDFSANELIWLAVRKVRCQYTGFFSDITKYKLDRRMTQKNAFHNGYMQKEECPDSPTISEPEAE